MTLPMPTKTRIRDYRRVMSCKDITPSFNPMEFYRACMTYDVGTLPEKIQAQRETRIAFESAPVEEQVAFIQLWEDAVRR